MDDGGRLMDGDGRGWTDKVGTVKDVSLFFGDYTGHGHVTFTVAETKRKINCKIIFQKLYFK